MAKLKCLCTHCHFLKEHDFKMLDHDIEVINQLNEEDPSRISPNFLSLEQQLATTGSPPLLTDSQLNEILQQISPLDFSFVTNRIIILLPDNLLSS